MFAHDILGGGGHIFVIWLNITGTCTSVTNCLLLLLFESNRNGYVCFEKKKWTGPEIVIQEASSSFQSSHNHNTDYYNTFV